MSVEIQTLIERRSLSFTYLRSLSFVSVGTLLNLQYSVRFCGQIFVADSDIDVLVTFAPEAKRGLTETLQMQDELTAMFHREVDFIVKTALEKSQNWLRRQTILDSAQVIYATR
jgi:hypothetical protein